MKIDLTPADNPRSLAAIFLGLLCIPMFVVGCASQPADVAEAATPADPTSTVASDALADPEERTLDSGATVWTYALDGIRIHTYMSPFDAFGNNTHVIEGPNSLVVVDPQMTITFATEVRGFVDGLGKPIDRLFVSHAHPDHYLGVAAAWEDVEVFALQATVTEIEQTGEQVRQAREAMFPEGWLTDHVTAPGQVISTGEQTIDGIRYILEERDGAEHAVQLAIRLPDHDVTIAQDILYTVVHPVITDRNAIDTWIRHLDDFVADGDTTLVLAGHGPPTDETGLVAMKSYLSRAQSILATVDSAEAFKAAIMEAFPDRVGEGFVDFSNLFLFGPPK